MAVGHRGLSDARRACGLTTEQQIQCWGSAEDATTPIFDGSFRQLDAGGNTVCGITTDHELRCQPASFGWNNGVTMPSGHFDRVAVSPDGLPCAIDSSGRVVCLGERFAAWHPTNVAMLRLTRAGACALLGDGRVVCHGEVSPPPDKRFRYISRADYLDGFCGIDEKWRVYCWGVP